MLQLIVEFNFVRNSFLLMRCNAIYRLHVWEASYKKTGVGKLRVSLRQSRFWSHLGWSGRRKYFRGYMYRIGPACKKKTKKAFYDNLSTWVSDTKIYLIANGQQEIELSDHSWFFVRLFLGVTKDSFVTALLLA